MKKPREIINQLSPEDALDVLNALADSDAKLAERIAEIATEYLREVDPEDVAADVLDALESLEVEDVWDQAGPSRYGYRDTDEVADEMIGNALEPYREELNRYQKLSMPEEATSVCMGILAGLYQFEYESSSEFKDWAADLPVFYAEDALKTWRTKHVSQQELEQMEAFIHEHLPKWRRMQSLLKKPPGADNDHSRSV